MIERPTTDPSSSEFFEGKYQECADPWNFSGSAYELDRYDTTMRALAGRHFRHAFEPGCSVGVLTERLARICGRVDAMDLSPTAVGIAKARCARLGNVHVWTGSLADPLPEFELDLVVLSEIGYYFNSGGLEQCGRAVLERLVPGGWLLAVHWLGHSNDHRLSGDTVHEVLRSLNGLILEHSECHTGFRLDRWTRP